MKSKCFSAIAQYGMLEHGDVVVVGVSGGADSMALLHFLHNCADSFGIHVIAAHFHHGIRGEEADRDQEFVRDFCEKNEIPFVTENADIPLKSRQMQMSTEECARACRYEFLQSVCANAKIATAHTNSDSCESFLLNFTRGTGLQGLCGIPAVRENIIRPLIFCSSQDTRDYCLENNISWCEDSSNSNDIYARNAVRLHSIPALKGINAQFEINALRCMRILQSDNEYLNLKANEAYDDCVSEKEKLLLDRLNQYHEALQTRVLLKFARNNGCKDVSMSQVERLRHADECDVITLNGAVRFKRKDNILFLLHEMKDRSFTPIGIDDKIDSVHFFDSLIYFKFDVYNNEILADYNSFIDADKIFNPVLRTRAAGDKIRLRERKCSKTIKQLFSEKKIPSTDRDAWPVLADDKGVIWIGGFGIDESRLADRNTKNILMVEWRQTL